MLPISPRLRIALATAESCAKNEQRRDVTCTDIIAGLVSLAGGVADNLLKARGFQSGPTTPAVHSWTNWTTRSEGIRWRHSEHFLPQCRTLLAGHGSLSALRICLLGSFRRFVPRLHRCSGKRTSARRSCYQKSEDKFDDATPEISVGSGIKYLRYQAKMTKTASKIRFRAKLFRPAAIAKAGAWTFLTLPKDASAKLSSRGMTTVEGTINGFPFRATLEPDGQKSHWLMSCRKKPAFRVRMRTGISGEVETHECEPCLNGRYRYPGGSQLEKRNLNRKCPGRLEKERRLRLGAIRARRINTKCASTRAVTERWQEFGLQDRETERPKSEGRSPKEIRRAETRIPTRSGRSIGGHFFG